MIKYLLRGRLQVSVRASITCTIATASVIGFVDSVIVSADINKHKIRRHSWMPVHVSNRNKIVKSIWFVHRSILRKKRQTANFHVIYWLMIVILHLHFRVQKEAYLFSMFGFSLDLTPLEIILVRLGEVQKSEKKIISSYARRIFASSEKFERLYVGWL